METITIELRFDPIKGHREILQEAARQAAKLLLVQAQLIAGRRKPQIALHGSDFIEGTEQIDLFTAEERQG